jgi:hypothetical protein
MLLRLPLKHVARLDRMDLPRVGGDSGQASAFGRADLYCQAGTQLRKNALHGSSLAEGHLAASLTGEV